MKNEELKNLIIDKMRVQWKTISKAFKDMNKDIHSDGISDNELRFYLDHWGLKMSDEKFKQIYSKFDNCLI